MHRLRILLAGDGSGNSDMGGDCEFGSAFRFGGDPAEEITEEGGSGRGRLALTEVAAMSFPPLILNLMSMSTFLDWLPVSSRIPRLELRSWRYPENAQLSGPGLSSGRRDVTYGFTGEAKTCFESSLGRQSAIMMVTKARSC